MAKILKIWQLYLGACDMSAFENLALSPSLNRLISYELKPVKVLSVKTAYVYTHMLTACIRPWR